MQFDVESLFNSGLEEDAVIETASGIKNLKTIFDNEFAANLNPEFEFEGSNPVAACKTEEVSDANQGDPFDYQDTRFKVYKIHPDGQGITYLELIYE